MKQDVINLCGDQWAATLRQVNEEFLTFVRELGGAKQLPSKFTLDVPAMKKLEKDIDQAVVDGKLQRTEDMCGEYKTRFTAYLVAWRKQIAKGASA